MCVFFFLEIPFFFSEITVEPSRARINEGEMEKI